MRFGQRLTLGMLVFVALAASGTALAGDGTPTMSVAGGGRTLADDKCVAQCDKESDACMLSSGKDAAKQRECDSTYDACLRKCN